MCAVMDVGGVMQDNADQSQMILNYLEFALQKKEGKTEGFI